MQNPAEDFSSEGIRGASVRICSRCIYDERVPAIEFAPDGICNYCRQVDRLKAEYGTGAAKGERLFRGIVNELRREGRNKPYDCIVGVSGGTDSSYLIYLAKEWGLRPLAVHYDNTWNSAIATMNICRVLKDADVDLYTHVVANREADDILKAFFLAGVAELDAATDLGYAYLLRLVAAKYGVRAIFEGHSFVAEGITPLGRSYFDGRYIQSIHQQYGRLKMDTFPLMTFGRFLKSAVMGRVRFIRPLWYLPYSKEDARKHLVASCGWQYYGGHHLENRITAFAHGVYLPKKFGADLRNNTLAAQVREGALSRSDAWAEYSAPPHVEEGLVQYFKKRLGLSDSQYNAIMAAKPRNWIEFPTYKRRFEVLWPLFYVLARTNRVPMSFYLKYCFKSE